MRKFSEFHARRVMVANSASPQAERHVRQYLNEDVRVAVNSSGGYRVDKAFGPIPAGEKVLIKDCSVENGHYTVTALFQAEEVRIPISRLNKPAVGRAGQDPEAAEAVTVNEFKKEFQGHLRALEKKGHTVYTDNTKKTFHPRFPGVNVQIGQTNHQVFGVSRIEQRHWRSLGHDGKKKPKADMAFTDRNGKIMPETCLSLKLGIGKSQSQFGGTTEHADNSIVKSFVDKVSSYVNKPEYDLQLKRGLKYPLDPNNLEHADLINKAGFGKSYKKGYSHGVNNCLAVMSGKIKMQRVHTHKCKDRECGSKHLFTYKLISEKTIVNDSRGHASDFGPVAIVARTDKTRSNHGLPGTRTMIVPEFYRPHAKAISDD